MPMGPGPAGFGYFVAVKAAGYCAAAGVLAAKYPQGNTPKRGWLLPGLARTAVGVAAGMTYGLAWYWLSTRVNLSDWAAFAFYAGLFPIRLCEWLFLIWLFFDRPLVHRSLDGKAVIGGTFWSYALDAVGVVAAFVIPGGMWVC